MHCVCWPSTKKWDGSWHDSCQAPRQCQDGYVQFSCHTINMTNPPEMLLIKLDRCFSPMPRRQHRSAGIWCCMVDSHDLSGAYSNMPGAQHFILLNARGVAFMCLVHITIISGRSTFNCFGGHAEACAPFGILIFYWEALSALRIRPDSRRWTYRSWSWLEGFHECKACA